MKFAVGRFSLGWRRCVIAGLIPVRRGPNVSDATNCNGPALCRWWPTDALARIIAERMREALGQPVIIENVSGAAGTIGVGRVARAEPDGYTISLGPWNSHVVTGAIYSLQWDLLKDFEPVAVIADNPAVIVSKSTAPATNLKELIAWIKANPDKLSAGTSGVGAATHVAGILFQKLTATRFQFFLPQYPGAGPALQDLLAARNRPHVRSGSQCDATGPRRKNQSLCRYREDARRSSSRCSDR